jgi:hypothetical protein
VRDALDLRAFDLADLARGHLNRLVRCIGLKLDFGRSRWRPVCKASNVRLVSSKGQARRHMRKCKRNVGRQAKKAAYHAQRHQRAVFRAIRSRCLVRTTRHIGPHWHSGRIRSNPQAHFCGAKFRPKAGSAISGSWIVRVGIGQPRRARGRPKY